eukprot:scaffold29055_cov71-Isochrysis_galbana.AAC.1
MQLHISASKEEVRASYLPALRKPLVRPLEVEGAAGVNQTLQLMDAYGLTKDDLDAILEMQVHALPWHEKKLEGRSPASPKPASGWGWTDTVLQTPADRCNGPIALLDVGLAPLAQNSPPLEQCVPVECVLEGG